VRSGVANFCVLTNCVCAGRVTHEFSSLDYPRHLSLSKRGHANEIAVKAFAAARFRP